ncbi:hypothetical protein GOB93_05865 [Acetobacter musti]|uniref:HNH nuclease domain-containing protein n=2 Tax=Acetobacter musti TaxID=864732 RepID=A0ABX0JN26_9PROT|nr:hypothetical protein [Acetobacter musti]
MLSPCWNWTGAVKQGTDRPTFGLRGKMVSPYRTLYQHYHGPLPEGKVVRHRCDNPLCCNPHHLEAGTHKENSHDMTMRNSRGRPLARLQMVVRHKEDGMTVAEIASVTGLHHLEVDRLLEFHEEDAGLYTIERTMFGPDEANRRRTERLRSEYAGLTKMGEFISMNSRGRDATAA